MPFMKALALLVVLFSSITIAQAWLVVRAVIANRVPDLTEALIGGESRRAGIVLSTDGGASATVVVDASTTTSSSGMPLVFLLEGTLFNGPARTPLIQFWPTTNTMLSFGWYRNGGFRSVYNLFVDDGYVGDMSEVRFVVATPARALTLMSDQMDGIQSSSLGIRFRHRGALNSALTSASRAFARNRVNWGILHLRHFQRLIHAQSRTLGEHSSELISAIDSYVNAVIVGARHQTTRDLDDWR